MKQLLLLFLLAVKWPVAAAAENTACQQYADKNQQAACFEAYTSPLNQANQAPVPYDCWDENGVFIPVQYIYSRSSYQVDSGLYQPVEADNGVLAHDFNHDDRPDYVFVERDKQDHIRLATCLSNAEGYYRREPTKVTLQEFKKPDLYVRFHVVVLENRLLRITDASHAHNDGTDSTTDLYAWNPARRGFALNKTTHQTWRGDGMMADMREEYDFQHRTYRIVTDCSNVISLYDPECKSSEEHGELQLEGEAPLLAAVSSAENGSHKFSWRIKKQ